MRLREMMQTPAFTCPPTTTLSEAVHLMHLHEMGSAVVVDDARIVGIVTDRDIALKGYGRDLPASAPVSRVMSGAVVTISAEADTYEAAAKMINHGVRRLPVVDAGGSLVGVVAFDDLFMVFEQEGDALRRALAAQTRKGTGGWAGWD